MPDISLALRITIIGMSLVFAAIILLWGVIGLLVRLTQKQTRQDVVQSEAEYQRKKIAAIAAITVALARELDSHPHEFPLPATAIVSAWQAVMRGKMLNKRGSIR